VIPNKPHSKGLLLYGIATTLPKSKCPFLYQYVWVKDGSRRDPIKTSASMMQSWEGNKIISTFILESAFGSLAGATL
jgi:hypothetical protein